MKGMARLARHKCISNLKLLQNAERKELPLSLVSSALPGKPGLMQIKS